MKVCGLGKRGCPASQHTVVTLRLKRVFLCGHILSRSLVCAPPSEMAGLGCQENGLTGSWSVPLSGDAFTYPHIHLHLERAGGCSITEGKSRGTES